MLRRTDIACLVVFVFSCPRSVHVHFAAFRFNVRCISAAFFYRHIQACNLSATGCRTTQKSGHDDRWSVFTARYELNILVLMGGADRDWGGGGGVAVCLDLDP